ncbi:hypothetical protein LSTR_LSTR003711 [Laodelphax striatellus]|uniref:Uncharacterized protein n=1 Tax=Laodelphax striatellus TaxID=195883 RepID=A0A482WZM8_LAOST|nr:hypothetical protein LSTR_LSTR003711 [Laodelphax striatellus]
MEEIAENVEIADAAEGPGRGQPDAVPGQFLHQPPPSQRIPGQIPASWVYYDGRGHCYRANSTSIGKRNERFVITSPVRMTRAK